MKKTKKMESIYNKIIVGIDPGSSNGGIAVWKKTDPAKTIRMPSNDDVDSLSDYFRYLREGKDNVIVFIEKVQMFMSDSSDENKGKQFRIKVLLANYEKMKALLIYHKLEFVEVYPQSWQSTLGLKGKYEDDKEKKNAFKEYAQNCFPEVKVTLWNSDALCLIQFALRKWETYPSWIEERLQNKQGTKLF